MNLHKVKCEIVGGPLDGKTFAIDNTACLRIVIPFLGPNGIEGIFHEYREDGRLWAIGEKWSADEPA